MMGCPSGKMICVSKAEADHTARRMKKQFKRRSYYYQCPMCQNWHLTTQKQYS